MALALTRELVSYILDRTTDTALGGELHQLANPAAFTFSVEAAELLGDALEGRALNPELRDTVASSLVQLDAPLARYLCARLAAMRGDFDEAIADLSNGIAALPRPEPALLALRARWYVRKQQLDKAAADLKLAIQTHPPYPFYVRTEKLVDKVLASATFKARREIRFAVLASSTTALLVPVLRAAFFARGVKATIYEATYGNYRQEVLDPSSGLYAFRPDIALLLTNTRDLDLPPTGGANRAQAFCHELRGLWTQLLQRNPCHIIQVGFEAGAGGAWGSLEDTLPEGRVRVVQQANAALSADLPAGVSYLGVESIFGPSELDSPREWHASKQYPGAAHLPAFANAVCAQTCAALGLSAKVLVLDLDNTLWGGVIGEDGLGGIKIGPPSADGEGYQELQRYAKGLKARGILLAVCSKNNRADAEQPFRQHEEMVLKLEDFAAFRANWDDKASNLRSLANELSLGLDSFVFLDDNPFERSWVRGTVPEVTVPEAGKDPWEMLAALKRGMYFEAIAITNEDTERSLSYQVNASMRSAEEGGQQSLEQFLTSLNMVSQCGPVDANTLQRVTQLINKTNQFNLTGRRYTAEQVRQMVESREWWCQSFRLADRFGDHGLIGVMIARVAPHDWTVDTWLMSCRVLGRRMEEFMASQLIEAATKAGAQRVIGRYVKSDKNAMVADLYPRMGFVAGAEPGMFVFEVGADVPASPWINKLPILSTPTPSH